MHKTHSPISTRQTTPTPKTISQSELLKTLRDKLELLKKGSDFRSNAAAAAESISILSNLFYYAKSHPDSASTLKDEIARLNPLIKISVQKFLEDGEYLFARELALKAGLGADDTKEFRVLLVPMIKTILEKQERQKKT